MAAVATPAVEEATGRIVSATRLHLPPGEDDIPEVTRQHLQNYIRSSQKLGVVAAIAVNSHEAAVRALAEEAAPGFEVHVLPVPCWGAFVPALNALLGFAQKTGKKYVLYQSLEVECTTSVLQLLLDHHTADTLVVGPVLSGHDFRPGEQQLNGRTAPWNTLALWSVRKLALTGFLCIADGLPDANTIQNGDGGPASPAVYQPGNPQEFEEEPGSPLGPMGSNTWWNEQDQPLRRQDSCRPTVPAGVEEVTAIALLQHLLGRDRANAVLVQLPPNLQAEVSWSASWGKDERRQKWHAYKMASKVSRPAAQLRELFKFQGRAKMAVQDARTRLATPLCGGRRGAVDKAERVGEATSDAADADGGPSALSFGSVMHYGESIPPPMAVKWICLAALSLFYCNSTAVLASAFHLINTAPAGSSAPTMIFVALLIGGVFVPMPVSLWLTRTVIRRANHIAGLVLFAGILLATHLSIVVSQVLGAEWQRPYVLLVARLVQGLGSGVLFQVRFVLATVSTSDQHANVQSWSFLASDLGLGLGALLPAATSLLLGGLRQLQLETSELMPSSVLALISLCYLAWVLTAFPRRLPALSDRVRFKGAKASHRGGKRDSLQGATKESYRRVVWLSGTTRVFVQSAIMPVLALSMRDAGWTGNFRQTFAVAAICLLPMPFEALASRLLCSCCLSRAKGAGDGTDTGKLISGFIGAVALLVAGMRPATTGESAGVELLPRMIQFAVLMIMLAMAAPINASRLYQLKDAEHSTVMLEWMKAYIGRLLGPLFAVLVYHWLGYRPLLITLWSATAGVLLTA